MFVKRTVPRFSALWLDKSLPPLHKPPRANKQVSKFFHLGVAGLLRAWESLACKILLATRSSAFGFHFLVLFCSYSRTQTGSRRRSRCFNILYTVSLHTSLQGLKPGLSNWGGTCGSSEAAPWKQGKVFWVSSFHHYSRWFHVLVLNSSFQAAAFSHLLNLNSWKRLK